MKSTPIRWWNVGRYEAECVAFDAEQPLSREVWESLQRHRREDFERMAMELKPWPIEPDPYPLRSGINAITEGGLHIRFPLRIQFPMHVGFIDV